MCVYLVPFDQSCPLKCVLDKNLDDIIYVWITPCVYSVQTFKYKLNQQVLIIMLKDNLYLCIYKINNNYYLFFLSLKSNTVILNLNIK